MWARRAAAASALLFVVAAVTWPLAWNGKLTGGTDVWFSLIPGMAGLAATIIWPPRWALVLLAAAVIPAQLVNHAAREPSINGLLLPDMIFSYSFCLLFVAAACHGHADRPRARYDPRLRPRRRGVRRRHLRPRGRSATGTTRSCTTG